MTKQQDTTGTIPVSVSTFGRLTEWLKKEVEQVRVDLRCLFDDLVKQGVLANNRDYLSGSIGSLDFFDDHLKKSNAYKNKVLFLASHDQVHEIKNKLINRFIEITQSHVQEVALTYPGLELRGSIYFKDDVFVSLFKDGMSILSSNDLKTGHHDHTQRMMDLDREYPGVLARIEEMRNAFRFYQEQNAFPVKPHRINVTTRIVPNETVESPQFPQEQHIARNRTDGGFDDDLPEDIYREFIDSFGMTEAFEKFRAERAQRKHDVDTELSEGPG